MSDSSQPEPQEPPYQHPPYPHQDPGDEDNAYPNDPEWRERYRLTSDVVSTLRELYDDHEAFEWLISPHPQLADETALDLIAGGNLAIVARVLQRMRESVYL